MLGHETHYNIYYPKKEVNIAETRLDNVLGVLWYTVKSLLLTILFVKNTSSRFKKARHLHSSYSEFKIKRNDYLPNARKIIHIFITLHHSHEIKIKYIIS